MNQRLTWVGVEPTIYAIDDHHIRIGPRITHLNGLAVLRCGHSCYAVVMVASGDVQHELICYRLLHESSYTNMASSADIRTK